MRSLLVDLTPVRVSPAFRRLWLGLSVANLGAQLTVVAVGLQVYALTQSTFAVGVLGVCALVPLIVFGLYGGALVDHYDRRTVALVASVVSWVAVLALVAQAAAGNEHVGVLYALVAVQSAAGAVNSPARMAIVPRLLEPRLMPAANALQTMGWNVALTVGPLVGAGLVAGIGYTWAYAVDAALFTFALAALLRLPPVPPEPSAHRSERLGLGSVVDGLRYLGTQPNVRMTFVVDLIAMVTSMPRVLFPAVGVLYLGGGETTTGVLLAAVAAGGIVAGLFSGGLARVRWQGRVIALAITAWGLSIVAFGLVLVVAGPTSPTGVLPVALALAVVTLALAGASDAVSSVFRQTILQTATPDDMRGRLQGVFVVVVAGGPRLGELVLGALSVRVGEGWAAVLGGVACVVLLWLLVRAQRAFWQYDAENPTP
ncbi:major facilitator superfamily MFS_1 [Cellulomonas flavigena DSM 20109]|uniref:Major facilitator superfamily MFS_1 n=1 Tax=Cellulomonas flavigena (strain ATCC 482 / DSM 20109 / BCRC 11376 / JCM 18109 / NBRC 3775 / NCIMB 8073 / NRS 134) TaxID=446466 RepID=D5ULX3_CELFN|nr:MFS transporter [Cellulomonas flavigena]ADG76079.1 major facilitator superfamily MFS_1 [Cellulomonas flavigena DSM 20109]